MSKLSMTRDEAMADLRAELKPGDVVYTLIRSVARSGMSRVIDFYTFRPDPRNPGKVTKHWLSYWIAAAGIGSFSEKHEAVSVRGCGMDMGFHCVYNLSRRLFADNPAEDCPYHGSGRNEDRGYWLNQEWI